jgi:hypothetical protein
MVQRLLIQIYGAQKVCGGQRGPTLQQGHRLGLRLDFEV